MERLIEHHSVYEKRFLLSSKESEAWHTNPGGDLFTFIAHYLCSLLPKRN